MDLVFYLKLCGLAAMGLVAAVVFRRGLAECHERVRRMSAWQRAAAMAFLAVAVVYGGGKTNGVDGAGSGTTNLVGMGTAPRRSAAPAYPDTVTDGEIAQGWRWTSGWTPAAVSHAMPDDARHGSKWHVRGAFQDVARVALDGWEFPYGSNALDHVWAFVDGRLRPALRRRGEDIVAVGSPMSAVPGRSRFWTRQTDDSALFTWENHFLARDTNRSVSAQVELWPNGDFAVRSNGCERVARRVDPDDLDGDGLPNGWDERPRHSDGDCYGQGEGWVRANFTNADEIAAAGGFAPWVDAQVGDGLENGLYRLTAEVETSGRRRVVVCVGDLAVTMTNSGTCVFLLEKGVRYDLATEPSDASVWFDAVDDLPAAVPPRMAAASPPRGAAQDRWHEAWERYHWTEDFGRLVLNPPYEMWPYGIWPGYVLWLPRLSVSPLTWHPTPEDPTETFTARFDDAPATFGAATFWWMSDPAVVDFLPADGRTTSATYAFGSNFVREIPYMGLTVCIADEYLEAHYGPAYYEDDDDDGVGPYVDMSVPGVIEVGKLVYCPVSACLGTNETGRLVLSKLASIGVEAWLDKEKTVPLGDVATFELGSPGVIFGGFYFEATSPSSAVDADAFSVELQTGGETYADQRRFTAIRRVVEPITCVRVGRRIVNPCCGIVGSNVVMKVDAWPQSYPDGAIRWRVAQGEATFPNGDTGREVAVCVEGTDDVRLEIDFGLGWEHASTMTLMPTELTEVTVFPVEICDEDESPSITVDYVNGLLREVNEIYEQVGLRFVCAPTVQRIVNRIWSKRGLADKKVSRVICNCLRGTGGVEVYFVKGGIPGEPIGRGGAIGAFLRKSASGRALAHEIGHVCGLADIYVFKGDKFVVDDYAIHESKVPLDWGVYDFCVAHDDLVMRLLMYGVDGRDGVDVPAGSVFGVVGEEGSYTKGQANVGRTGMTRYPPCN